MKLNYHEPLELRVFDDVVILFIPSMKDEIEPVFEIS